MSSWGLRREAGSRVDEVLLSWTIHIPMLSSLSNPTSFGEPFMSPLKLRDLQNSLKPRCLQKLCDLLSLCDLRTASPQAKSTHLLWEWMMLIFPGFYNHMGKYSQAYCGWGYGG